MFSVHTFFFIFAEYVNADRRWLNPINPVFLYTWARRTSKSVNMFRSIFALLYVFRLSFSFFHAQPLLFLLLLLLFNFLDLLMCIHTPASSAKTDLFPFVDCCVSQHLRIFKQGAFSCCQWANVFSNFIYYHSFNMPYALTIFFTYLYIRKENFFFTLRADRDKLGVTEG